MKIKDFAFPIGISLILLLVALHERGTLRAITRKKWSYETIHIKPESLLKKWKQGDFEPDEIALIDLIGIDRKKLVALYKQLEGKSDSIWFIESMNYGNPKSSSIEEVQRRIVKHEVNELAIIWRNRGELHSVIYGQLPPENAIGENEFTQKSIPPSLTFSFAPQNLLGGKAGLEQDSIIKDRFKLILDLANVVEAMNIYVQADAYEREMKEKVRKKEKIAAVSIHDEMIKYEIK